MILLLLATELIAVPRVDTRRDGHRAKQSHKRTHLQSSRQGRSLSNARHLPSDPMALHSFAAEMLKKHRKEAAVQQSLSSRDEWSSSTTSDLSERGIKRSDNSSVSSTSDRASGGGENEESLVDAATERRLIRASESTPSPTSGPNICIAITGVDSRIGVAQRHADANHVLRIWPSSGRIEIFSIPRGTHVEAGFKCDALNYLANLRSNKGREVYLRKLADIAGVGRIDYYVEMGFSQAIGLIEMLGFKDNAASTLHVLRTRKAYAVGDYQRCYNQGQFIRQQILNNFNKSTGFLGGIALRGALGLVETNLTVDVARSIIQQLEQQHFPSSPSAVTVTLKPAFKARMQVLNLSTADAVNTLNKQLSTRLTKSGYIGRGKAPAFNASSYESKLVAKIHRAEASVDRNPKAAIAALSQVYKQRSWIQIQDETKRSQYLKRVCETLARGYDNTGFAIEADNIRYFEEQQLHGAADMMGKK